MFPILSHICGSLQILAKDGTVVCLDTSNENDCNWMCLVQCAESEEEQNCIAYQMGTNIFYSTIKNIVQGEQLKVWYASYYAKKLGRPVKPTKNYKGILFTFISLILKLIFKTVLKEGHQFLIKKNNCKYTAKINAMFLLRIIVRIILQNNGLLFILINFFL